MCLSAQLFCCDSVTDQREPEPKTLNLWACCAQLCWSGTSQTPLPPNQVRTLVPERLPSQHLKE